jgi:hypothetical protein
MNPYTVLGLSATASAKEILLAATRALREKKYSARQIAEARQELMNPELRPLLDFICFVDLAPLLRSSDTAPVPLSADDLTLLNIFA